VPNSLFDVSEKEALLKFNHSPDEGEVIVTDHLPNLDAKNIYSLSAEVKKIFQDQYTHLSINHCSSSFIEQVLLTNKHNESKITLVNLQTSAMEIAVINSGKLLFYNSFAYQSPEDIIYFLLFVFEQLQLNPETISVELFGELEKNSPAYQLIYKYIRNIKLGDRPAALEYSIKIAALPKHHYYSLFSQFLY
jgi:ABC-type oligopeptide transport system ATPase subunit